MKFTRADIFKLTDITTTKSLFILLPTITTDYGYRVVYISTRNKHGNCERRIQYKVYESTEVIEYFSKRNRDCIDGHKERNKYIKLLKELNYG